MLVYDKHGNEIELLEKSEFYVSKELTLSSKVSGCVREIAIGNLLIVYGNVTFAEEWAKWSQFAWDGISISENVNFRDMMNVYELQYHYSGSIQNAEVFPAGTSLAFTFLYIVA